MRQTCLVDRSSTLDFGANPGNLRMLTYAPADLGPGAGLVVVLHGCTQTAGGYARDAGWIELADRFGFALLCPEQTRDNNPNLCFNWFRPADVARGAGEAASIAAMTQAASGRFETDPSRVFVTGLSAGGAMAGVMAAAYPERFAGAALIAGLPYGVAAGAADALKLMAGDKLGDGPSLGDRVRASGAGAAAWPSIAVWQGQADRVVRPAVGEAVARQWRDVHRVRPEPRRARTPQGREFELWVSDEGAPVVEVHRINGLGHGTPLKTAGPQGCGSVAPHLFDVGVSSSFESALSWGLADLDRIRRPAQAKPRRPHRPSAGSAAPGVQGVIEQALRAAGLMT